MSNFKFDASNLIKGLVDIETKTKAALGVYSDSVAKKMESYAKSNRKWNDRTGDARKRLTGSWERYGNGTRVAISHGVDYGVYLEFCNERRYAILKQTVDKVSPEALRGLNKILK